MNARHDRPVPTAVDAAHDRLVQLRDQDREAWWATSYVTLLALGLFLIAALWVAVFVLLVAPTITGTL